MNAFSEKVYLSLKMPTEDHSLGDRERIELALNTLGYENVTVPLPVLRSLYPMCREAGFDITVTLVYGGNRWIMTAAEPKDQRQHHYGLAVDYGSTTIVMQLVDLNSGAVVGEEKCVNGQVRYGTDILTRITYVMEEKSRGEDLQRATVETFQELLSRLTESSRESLVQILSDIPDYCTVVFVFSAVELKIDGRQKKLKETIERGLTVEFARQSQRELTSWIRRHFRTYGKEIGDKQCEYLTFVTGGTMTALSAEIGKIAAYAPGMEITAQDINAVVTPVLDAEIFDLTDAIAEGDYEKALLKLRTLLQMQEEVIPLLAAIGGSIGSLIGMYTFRHKTKHPKFYIGIPVILAAQVFLAVWIISKIA